MRSKLWDSKIDKQLEIVFSSGYNCDMGVEQSELRFNKFPEDAPRDASRRKLLRTIVWITPVLLAGGLI